ncbi:MAG: hypothetical protein PHV18_05215 [Lachnospiraceae bacterium]|nr:hypothetical protein [Lachnospiraceae bacterium]
MADGQGRALGSGSIPDSPLELFTAFSFLRAPVGRRVFPFVNFCGTMRKMGEGKRK